MFDTTLHANRSFDDGVKILHTVCRIPIRNTPSVLQAYVLRDRAILDQGAHAHYCLVSRISRWIPRPLQWHI